MAMDPSSHPSPGATRNHLKLEGPLAMLRPRKRLQKPCAKLQKHQQQPQPQPQRPTNKQKRQPQDQLPTRPAPVTPNNESTENRLAPGHKLPGVAPPSRRPTPRLQIQPPDLSDSKWSTYLGRGRHDIIRIMDSIPESVSKESLSPPAAAFPEFAHLTPVNAHPRLSIASTATTESALLRRRAKTPVLRIGQLESKSAAEASVSREPPRPRRQSAEVMAEEYRALLSVRTPTNHPEPRPENPCSPRRQAEHYHRRSPTPPGHYSASPVLREVTPPPPPAVDLARCSPTSDEETLVSFEEETIYFKPLSFSSSEPESPSTYYDCASPSIRSITPAPQSLGLEICVDLLTRELSSAIFNRSKASGPQTSSLQIWLMIEAYERLRDQLQETAGISGEESRSIEMMLDTWLRTLYTIHDSLAMKTRNGVSQTDLEALESLELD